MRDVAALHLLDGQPWSQSPWVDPLSLLGCYTSFVVDSGGGVADLNAHLDRLERDTAVLLGSAVDRALVVRRAVEHVAVAGGGPVRLRVAVLAQTPPLQPQDVRSLHVATSSRPVPHAPTGPWTVLTSPHVRALPAVKSVDPFLQLHLKRQARLAGADDALLARGEDLLEGTTWGLVAVGPHGVVAPEQDVLPSLGVARVLARAQRLGFAVERRPVRTAELAGLGLLLTVNAVLTPVALARVDEQVVDVDIGLLDALSRDEGAPGEQLR